MKKIFIILMLICSVFLGAKVIASSSYNVYSPQKYNFKDDLNERILFIVDYSESMIENLGNKRKIDVALDTLSVIIPKIVPSTKVGLRVYGHNAGFTMIQNCKASTLLIYPSVNNRKEILCKLRSYQPTGWTPITYSLKQAVTKDFSGVDGQKRIILLTDGGENCDESPCDYAMELIKQHKDIRIDVIAFAIDDEDAINQLKCAALVTKGRFYNADTSVKLMDSLLDSINYEKNVDAKILQN